MGDSEFKTRFVKLGVVVYMLGLAACQNAPPGIQDNTSPKEDAGATSPEASTDPDPTADGGSDAASDAAEASDATPVPKGGNDEACSAELGWWATNAAFDSSVTPGLASAVNPMFVGEHPFTIASYVDSSLVWTARASGTRTNGSYQQYYPYDHAGEAAAMTRSTSDFSTASGSEWIVAIDASSTEVWIQVVSETTSATYGDTYCQSLTGGKLSAVIPESAGSTSIVTSEGTTTLGTLLGATTSLSPKGWTVAMTFDGQKVDVSAK